MLNLIPKLWLGHGYYPIMLRGFCTIHQLKRVKYKHTNIVAKDWKKVVSFYENVFRMKVVGPKRNLKGDFVDKGVGYKNATICGVHMIMPGFDDIDSNPPTLEIFEYDGDITINDDQYLKNSKMRPIYEQGIGHLAFEVEDIETAIRLIEHHGGSMLSDSNEISSHNVKGQGLLKWCYVRDNEGNIIELQQWDNK